MRGIRALTQRVALLVALPALLLMAWIWTTRDSTNLFFPPATAVFETIGPTWFSGRFIGDIVPSVSRLLAGYAIALVLGLAVGIPLGLRPALRAFAEPTLEFCRAIPPPVMVPIIALFSGFTGSTSKVVAIALGCLWPVLLNTVAGAASLDPDLVDTGRAFHLTPRARLVHIVLPSASPQILAGARQALAIGVILMVITELFGSTNGIGYAIVQFQRTFAITQMWSGVIVLGLLGVMLAAVFHLVERRVLRWHTGMRRATRGE